MPGLKPATIIMVEDDKGDARRTAAGIAPLACSHIYTDPLAGLNIDVAKVDDARVHTTVELVAALHESIVPVTCGR